MKKNVKKFLFSDLIINATPTKRIAYVGVVTALSVVSNTFFEFRAFDVQFSVTIFFSIVFGVLLGSLLGFATCFMGDFVGYIINSWGQLYMPWVGLSTGFIALIAGIIINGIDKTGKRWLYVKIALTCIVTFFVCTAGINSIGFYFYNKSMGFSKAVVDYVTTRFNGSVSFFAYVCYRLIFKLQIVNSIFNYVLVFLLLPLILKIPYFWKDCTNDTDNTPSA